MVVGVIAVVAGSSEADNKKVRLLKVWF